VTLVVVGIVVLLLGVGIPENISQYLEFGVGIMIIFLSATALIRALRGRQDVHVHTHSHGEDIHSHLKRRIGLKPLLVGAMHGLAGSAALTLLVLTQVHSMLLGICYLLIFGFGSVFGMMAVSTLDWAAVRAQRRTFE
jgi:sulfite exporter TauE/SafE